MRASIRVRVRVTTSQLESATRRPLRVGRQAWATAQEACQVGRGTAVNSECQGRSQACPDTRFCLWPEWSEEPASSLTCTKEAYRARESTTCSGGCQGE